MPEDIRTKRWRECLEQFRDVYRQFGSGDAVWIYLAPKGLGNEQAYHLHFEEWAGRWSPHYTSGICCIGSSVSTQSSEGKEVLLVPYGLIPKQSRPLDSSGHPLNQISLQDTPYLSAFRQAARFAASLVSKERFMQAGITHVTVGDMPEWVAFLFQTLKGTEFVRLAYGVQQLAAPAKASILAIERQIAEVTAANSTPISGWTGYILASGGRCAHQESVAVARVEDQQLAADLMEFAQSSPEIQNMGMGWQVSRWKFQIVDAHELRPSERVRHDMQLVKFAKEVSHDGYGEGVTYPAAIFRELRTAAKMLREARDAAHATKANTIQASQPSPAAPPSPTSTPTIPLPPLTEPKPLAASPAAPSQAQRVRDRTVFDPTIRSHLAKNPYARCREVAAAVGCSSGVVAESVWWRANQRRLEGCKGTTRDPIAVPLDERWMSEVGASQGGQLQGERQLQAKVDDEIDARDKALAKKIGDFRRGNPSAPAEQVAKACGCSAREVEDRDALLARLAKEQIDSAREDDDPIAPKTPKAKGRKWAEKKA